MDTFYMMVGLPASGKSTYAEKLVKGTITRVRSSDDLREELLGNVNDMSQNSSIFDILHSLIKADIYEGSDSVYDATNLKAVYRKNFLDSLKLLECKKVCVYMKCPYEVCMERNLSRERVVPKDVMERMNKFLEPPTLDEGWDEIITVECAYTGGNDDGGDR